MQKLKKPSSDAKDDGLLLILRFLNHPPLFICWGASTRPGMATLRASSSNRTSCAAQPATIARRSITRRSIEFSLIRSHQGIGLPSRCQSKLPFQLIAFFDSSAPRTCSSNICLSRSVNGSGLLLEPLTTKTSWQFEHSPEASHAHLERRDQFRLAFFNAATDLYGGYYRRRHLWL